ncbi:MAG: hypothetical protein KC516_00995 [Nanoarchaeota archaeon]|nr:hypothetical protein [Nanoarchaeota archaeon]
MIKNKKGWIKILEAFIAILLLIVVISSIVISNNSNDNSLEKQVHEIESSILKEIQVNETLRSKVLSQSEIVKSGEENFPEILQMHLNNSAPPSLNCSGKICGFSDDCTLTEEELPQVNKDIYVKSTLISADHDIYSPKNVVIFCWRN